MENAEELKITFVSPEKFKVDIDWCLKTFGGDFFLNPNLDGFLIRPITQECSCPSRQLFESGCSCGGV